MICEYSYKFDNQVDSSPIKFLKVRCTVYYMQGCGFGEQGVEIFSSLYVRAGVCIKASVVNVLEKRGVVQNLLVSVQKRISMRKENDLLVLALEPL